MALCKRCGGILEKNADGTVFTCEDCGTQYQRKKEAVKIEPKAKAEEKKEQPKAEKPQEKKTSPKKTEKPTKSTKQTTGKKPAQKDKSNASEDKPKSYLVPLLCFTVLVAILCVVAYFVITGKPIIPKENDDQQVEMVYESVDDAIVPEDETL